MQKEMERCWLCRKQRTCPFECYGRVYCSDCFKDHCLGCNDVHRTKADVVNIDVKEFIELYEGNTDFITCAVCGIEGPRYSSVLIKDHPEVKPPLQALYEQQISELQSSGKNTDAIFKIKLLLFS